MTVYRLLDKICITASIHDYITGNRVIVVTCILYDRPAFLCELEFLSAMQIFQKLLLAFKKNAPRMQESVGSNLLLLRGYIVQCYSSYLLRRYSR